MRSFVHLPFILPKWQDSKFRNPVARRSCRSLRLQPCMLDLLVEKKMPARMKGLECPIGAHSVQSGSAPSGREVILTEAGDYDAKDRPAAPLAFRRTWPASARRARTCHRILKAMIATLITTTRRDRNPESRSKAVSRHESRHRVAIAGMPRFGPDDLEMQNLNLGQGVGSAANPWPDSGDRAWTRLTMEFVMKGTQIPLGPIGAYSGQMGPILSKPGLFCLIRQIGSGEWGIAPEMAEAARRRPRKLVSHLVNEPTKAIIARSGRQPDFQNRSKPLPHVQDPRIRF